MTVFQHYLFGTSAIRDLHEKVMQVEVHMKYTTIDIVVDMG